MTGIAQKNVIDTETALTLTVGTEVTLQVPLAHAEIVGRGILQFNGVTYHITSLGMGIRFKSEDVEEIHSRWGFRIIRLIKS